MSPQVEMSIVVALKRALRTVGWRCCPRGCRLVEDVVKDRRGQITRLQLYEKDAELLVGRQRPQAEEPGGNRLAEAKIDFRMELVRGVLKAEPSDATLQLVGQEPEQVLKLLDPG
jgi:hypothetical protein